MYDGLLMCSPFLQSIQSRCIRRNNLAVLLESILKTSRTVCNNINSVSLLYNSRVTKTKMKLFSPGASGQKNRKTSFSLNSPQIISTNIIYYYWMHFSSILLVKNPITWPEDNCLKIMVCFSVKPSKCILLQIIFCSCAIIYNQARSRDKNSRSIPRSVREWKRMKTN